MAKRSREHADQLKCPVCASAKGRRNCRIVGGLICAPCCARTRTDEQCAGCPHFKEAKARRRYGSVPRFDLHEMERRRDLWRYSDVIEGAICDWDRNHEKALTDAHAAQALEMLLDTHHFSDPPKAGGASRLIAEGYIAVERAIQRRLSDVPPDVLVKILSTIYFVLRRRGMRSRDYFEIIHRFVGAPGESGYMRRFHAEEAF